MRNTALQIFQAVVVFLGLALAAGAHPMGNFSVNHYSRLHFMGRSVEITYVLDLAEIPAFQLLQQWGIDQKDPQLLSQRSQLQAKEWIGNIVLSQDRRRLPLKILSVSPAAVEGAGGMSVLRIAIQAEAGLQHSHAPNDMTYEDGNFPGRAGWKEIVIDHDPSAAIQDPSQGSQDLSRELTYYPTDPGITPPQDLTAHVRWSPVLVTSPAKPTAVTETSVVPEQEKPESASFSQQQPETPGSVVRGDFLSRMLQKKELAGGVILIGILVAFGLGAMHAMSPGHGKTIVAAYLVGNRGTMKHAALLGFVVTFTHTFTVFLLGLGILFFQQYIVAEKIVPILGAISGLSIVSIGVMLLYQRSKALIEGGSSHAHSHGDHDHFHVHDHDHDLEYAHAGGGQREVSMIRPTRTRIAELRAAEPDHQHSHGSGLTHSHGGSTHSHMVEGDITPGSLIALGISGGLVPCPSALVLMLSAIALGHAGLGLILLIGFSSGLALVLMAFGMLAVYAKHLLPKSDAVNKPIFRLIPVFSAVVVIVLGIAMTAVSAGWIQPLRFLS